MPQAVIYALSFGSVPDGRTMTLLPSGSLYARTLDLHDRYLFWSVLSERGHDSAHLLHSALALESEVEKNIFIVAVFFIYLGHLLGEGFALRFIICRHLADEQRRNYRILVSRVQTGKITVAL